MKFILFMVCVNLYFENGKKYSYISLLQRLKHLSLRLVIRPTNQKQAALCHHSNAQAAQLDQAQLDQASSFILRHISSSNKYSSARQLPHQIPFQPLGNSAAFTSGKTSTNNSFAATNLSLLIIAIIILVLVL